MSLFQLIILSVTQGVTEFLPISSSGHLNLIQALFGIPPHLAFDIFLNTATLLSVLVFFWFQKEYFFKNINAIVIGTLPVVIVGFLLKDSIEVLFADTRFLWLSFTITSIFALLTKKLYNKDKKLTTKNALIIGLFQSLAILPGVSRSGATIFSALLLGLSPSQAFNFSFSLFIPASFGALVLDIENIRKINYPPQALMVSFLITFIFGLVSLLILKKTLLVQKRFWLFGVYTSFVALALCYLSL